MPFFLVTRESIQIGETKHEGAIVEVETLPDGAQHLVFGSADVEVVIGADFVEVLVSKSTDPNYEVYFPSVIFGDDASLGSLKGGPVQLRSFVLQLSPDLRTYETFLYFLVVSKSTVSLEWHQSTPTVITLSALR